MPLDGRGAADRATCWRLSCQLLNQVMRDKVMPVRLAAFDLFVDTFGKVEGAAVAQAEANFALSVLVEHLIDRLGDSNLRLHESARRCVLFAAEMPALLGLGGVLARLRARMEGSKGNERTKVHFGILDVVNVLLEHFPGRRGAPVGHQGDEDLLDDADAARSSVDSWTQHDVAAFIVAGMDDSLGQRVRDRAAALAVTVYQTFGMEATKPILAGLRPAKQALLKQKFEESELEDGEFPDDEDDGEEGTVLAGAALEGLVVCGSAVRAPVWYGSSPEPGGLPGAMGDEEMLMDGILEDAGMVFGGTGIMPEPARPLHHDRSSGSLDGGTSRVFAQSPGATAEEDHLLEEELRRLGLEGFEDLHEQEALLQSIQESAEESRCHAPQQAVRAAICEDLSVEDLLDTFDDAPVGRDELSIEVC